MSSTAGPSSQPPPNPNTNVPNRGDDTGSGGNRKKRKNHRGGRKKKAKQQSQTDDPLERTRPGQSGDSRPPFYRAYQSDNLNLSGTSLDSDTLLDHRDHQPMRIRRDSRAAQTGFSGAMSSSFYRRRQSRVDEADEANTFTDDPRAPLLGPSTGSPNAARAGRQYGGVKSSSSSTSSKRRRGMSHSYDINNPPSVPASPTVDADQGLGDVLGGEFLSHPPGARRQSRHEDFVVDIDGDGDGDRNESPTNAYRGLGRRHTVAGIDTAEEDVCFPTVSMSELASGANDEDYADDLDDLDDHRRDAKSSHQRHRRNRWPDLEVLEEWAAKEKEERSEGVKARKVREPQYVGGRLRPKTHGWHRQPEDAPYRFTYFNETLDETIHARTISELLQEGQTFKDLFLPDPPELSDYSDTESDDEGPLSTYKMSRDLSDKRSDMSPADRSRAGTRQSSILDAQSNPQRGSKDTSGDLTPVNEGDPREPDKPFEKTKRYGQRPTFWLDVLSPTDAEMKIISRTFGLHMLTSEDILMQESREKVELFRHYYFIHYRTFEQDPESKDYMEPVNMYIVVFREGVITFHFSMTPHPANVRRRIRQLNDYLVLNPDWLSYALIDDITDAYQPVIESIEEKVDEIDDAILGMHSGDHNSDSEDGEEARKRNGGSLDEKASLRSNGHEDNAGGNMLRRVGRIRKKVMKLGRLLGTKADVIKGFAKRCNEHWEIAPRSDIGMFLGDIQDHILTMQSALGHYEMLLSRAHSNYLAQINIRMNERQEETSGSLNKLTVLGTIVLPMNIVTGMWGMNVKVPGQGVDNLAWFFGITTSLFAFGSLCWFLAKLLRVI